MKRKLKLKLLPLLFLCALIAGCDANVGVGMSVGISGRQSRLRFGWWRSLALIQAGDECSIVLS